VLDAVLGAGPVEAVTAGRGPLPVGAESVGKLLTVVRQSLSDLEGGLRKKPPEKALDLGRGLVGQDLDLDPARGPVDAGAQVSG
jgi:hypothetical protein